jgi:hypothetical protein
MRPAASKRPTRFAEAAAFFCAAWQVVRPSPAPLSKPLEFASASQLAKATRMSSVRLASTLLRALAVSARSRPSEPSPGPGAGKACRGGNFADLEITIDPVETAFGFHIINRTE